MEFPLSQAGTLGVHAEEQKMRTPRRQLSNISHSINVSVISVFLHRPQKDKAINHTTMK
jgi:hypothetical protein